MEEMNQDVTAGAAAGEAESTLDVRWTESSATDAARVGAMYCFKSCDVNNN